MKDYHAEISITFCECGEAENEEQAIKKVKEDFFNDYGLRLTGEEIKIELTEQGE